MASSTARQRNRRLGGAGDRRRAVLVLAGILAVGLALAWVLLGSPWLRVTRVDVVGGDGGQKAQVRAITDRLVGQPLVKVDSSAVQREIAGVPSLARVDVTRDWPDELSVSITPRVPVLALQKAKGVVELVDGEGVAYATVDSVPGGLPTAELAHPDQERERLAAARVMGALDAGQRGEVSKVKVSSPDDVRFSLHGVTVLWGGPSDGRTKAVVLAALLQQKGVTTINVSAPDSPVAS